MKKVITLSAASFKEECARLSKTCEIYGVDVVLGIESGGKYVAEQILPGLPHCSIALRRPSTDMKGGLITKVLQRLPRKVADVLRVIEARMLEMRGARTIHYDGPMPEELSGANSVLVVDDAVDSGATMMAVLEAVRGYCPGAVVHTAAIVVTTANPMIKPDVTLYEDVLIRFPWSKDSRK